MATDQKISLQEIRDRAYELWDRNHRPEGMEIEFWLLAERELRAERRAAALHAEGKERQGGPDDRQG